MVVGPLARVLSQFAVIAGTSIFRAAVNAYREAAARGFPHHHPSSVSGGGKLAMGGRRRMTADDAMKILGVSQGTQVKDLKLDDVLQRHKRLYELNEPNAEAKFGGSPYIQKKVENARAILEECIHELDKVPEQPEGSRAPP